MPEAEAVGPLIQSGTLANRPVAGIVNSYYWATDVQMLYRDNGVIWEPVAHGNLGGVTFGQHHAHYYKYLKTYPFDSSGLNLLTLDTAGRAFLAPLEVPFRCTLDRLVAIWADVTAGNVRMGLYVNNTVAVNTPVGGALVVETASVAKTGTYRTQEITISNIVVDPGFYFLAIMSDETTSRCPMCWSPFLQQSIMIGAIYDRFGGYGPFTNPCPALAAYDEVPDQAARIASIP